MFHPTPGPVPLDDPGRWWAYVRGANWRHPGGPSSDYAQQMEVTGLLGDAGHSVSRVLVAIEPQLGEPGSTLVLRICRVRGAFLQARSLPRWCGRVIVRIG